MMGGIGMDEPKTDGNNGITRIFTLKKNWERLD